MVSDEGPDAYGAVTWGQFFVCQGFNPHVGWIHRSHDRSPAQSFECPGTMGGNGEVGP